MRTTPPLYFKPSRKTSTISSIFNLFAPNYKYSTFLRLSIKKKTKKKTQQQQTEQKYKEKESDKKCIKQSKPRSKCCLFFVDRLCEEKGERRRREWIDRVSGEEINIMNDISKSNMHESTMPPMAQQTNSWIKDWPGGKLQERSKSYFIIKTNKNHGSVEGGEKNRKKGLLAVLFLYSLLFHSLLCLFTELDCHFLHPLFSFLSFPPLFLLPHPWRESAILSQSLDECQARFEVVGLRYVKTCLRVCFAAKQGSVSLEQSRQRLTWLRFVGTLLLFLFSSKLFGCCLFHSCLLSFLFLSL